MYVLVATRGPHKLQYLGGHKFAKSGRPTLFPSRDAAITLGTFLKDKYPVLRPFALSTVKSL